MSESNKYKEHAIELIQLGANNLKKLRGHHVVIIGTLSSIAFALLYIGSILDKHLSTIAKNSKKNG